jgi:hypothetical protein
MFINSNYSEKLSPTMKENWLVQIFTNSKAASATFVDDTPDLAFCFAAASGSTTAKYNNIDYIPAIINKPSINYSLDLKSFTTRTGTVTLNVANVDIDGTKLLERLGSTFLNSQVNILSQIDDDNTTANALQIFNGRVSSFSYRNNIIVITLISNRPFQNVVIPNTKTLGISTGIDIPFVLGEYTANTGVVGTDSAAVFPTPFLRNDGENLVFILPDKIPAGTTSLPALEFYDTNLQRFLPLNRSGFASTTTSKTKDGASTVEVHSTLFKDFTVLPNAVEDEAENLNNVFHESAGNFTGTDTASNIIKTYDNDSATYATITGSLNPLSADDNDSASVTFFLKVPKPEGKLTDFNISFMYDLDITSNFNETQTGVHIYLNNAVTSNVANTSNAIDILGSSTLPIKVDSATTIVSNISEAIFASVCPNNQLPDMLALTVKLKGGIEQAGGNEAITMTLKVKKIHLEMQTSLSTTDEPIAKQAANANIKELYLSQDITTPTFDQHGSSDDVVNNPVTMHRELLKSALDIDFAAIGSTSADTQINDSGFITVNDLRDGAGTTANKWKSRLILRKESSLESTLKQLQYEGCFFFEFSPQAKQVNIVSGVSPMRYFTIADGSPTANIDLSQIDIRSYEIGITEVGDLETKFTVNFDRHPSNNRYLQNTTYTSSTHSGSGATIYEADKHQKQEFSLDYLYQAVDGISTTRNSDWVSFRSSLFGAYKTTVNATIINPTKYAMLQIGDVLDFGDILFGSAEMGSPFSEISDTFDSFVAMPTRLFSEQWSDKKFIITNLKRQIGHVSVQCREVS